MKIVVDLTQLADNLSGLERYAMNITKEMILADTENEYVLLYKNHACEQLEEINQRDNVTVRIYRGGNKLLFNQLKLPFYLYREKKADKFLFLAFPCPLLFKKKGIYTLIADLTCWDCPETMKAKAKYYFRATIRHSVRVSEGLITISAFSRRRILEHFGGKAEESRKYKRLADKILLAYCAVGSAFTQSKEMPETKKAEIRDKYHLPKHYLLCLSTLEPRKNLRLLLKSYSTLLQKYQETAVHKAVTPLVLAGRKGWLMDELLSEIENKYPGKVIVTGFIEDADLPQIYKMADCFVFPSLYEGFGMPPLEALAVGTPVISSDAASMPEVLGEHAIYFANGSEEELTDCLQNCMQEMPEQAPYTDPRFDWGKSAKKILDCLNRSVSWRAE